MLKKMDEARKRAETIDQQRDENDRRYLEKENLRSLKEQQLAETRAKNYKVSRERQSQIRQNRYVIVHAHHGTAAQAKTVSRLSDELKAKLQM